MLKTTLERNFSPICKQNQARNQQNLAKVGFGMQLEGRELKEFQKDQEAARPFIGEWGPVLHDPQLPRDPQEDCGIGSRLTNSGIAFYDVLNKHFGATIAQAGPEGYKTEASPYTCETAAGDIYRINLRELAGEKWSGILSEQTFEMARTNHNAGMPANKIDYGAVFKNYPICLNEAYETFEEKLNAPNPDKNILEMNKKFQEFNTKSNAKKIEGSAIYKVLCNLHANDPEVQKKGNIFINWNEGLDKHLFEELHNGNPEAEARIDELKQEHGKEIESFKFAQFILADQIERNVAVIEKQAGMKVIGDRQVAFSVADVFARPKAFLLNPAYRMGVPPDYFSKTGQAWDFFLLNPDELFTKDGKLGESGKILDEAFGDICKNYKGGYRRDHAVGDIDPFCYPQGSNPADPLAGRLFSSPLHPVLSKYSIVLPGDVNTDLEPGNDNYVREEALETDPVNYEKLFESEYDPNNEQKISKEQFVQDKFNYLINEIIIPYAEQKEGISKEKECKKLGLDPKNPVITAENKEKVTKEAARIAGIKVDKYAAVIEKILIPAAEKNGLSKDDIIFEDLGTLTTPVRKVFERLNLGGLRVTEFVDPNDSKHPYRGKNVQPQHVIVNGTHDNDTLSNWVDENSQNPEEFELRKRNLAEDLKLKPEQLKTKLDVMTAYLAELFASPAKKVLIPVMDVLGLSRFNTPGESLGCWQEGAHADATKAIFRKIENKEVPNPIRAQAIALASKDDPKAQELAQKMFNWAEKVETPEAVATKIK